MSEFIYAERRSAISSAIVGSSICWAAGIGLAVFAVAFAHAGSSSSWLLGLAVLSAGALLCGLAQAAAPLWKLRLSAVLISLAVVLLLAEGILRIATFHPLRTTSNLVPHARLGYTLDPALPETDANGFCNAFVPEQADVVTIGDSHTQGFGAAQADSWPVQFGEITTMSVYNMGVDGYGPAQYELLVDDALKLNPKHIIIGLHLGNDLSDAARGIEQRDTTADINNSFRYGLKYHTAVGSALHHLASTTRVTRPAGFELAHPRNPTYVSHKRVQQVTASLDMNDVELAKAFQTALGMLTTAKAKCDQAVVQLHVLVFPSRESAFMASLSPEQASAFPELQTIAQRETTIRQQTLLKLSQHQIKTVDVLPMLADALNSTDGVYPAHDDGHPQAAGYAVYAQAAAKSVLNR